MIAAAASRRSRAGAARLIPALGFAVLCWSSVPAAAQFGWFGQPEVSSQDVYDTIASQGFRLAGPLMRTRDVYVADVFDRRQRRERLIISRNTGEIVQRFMVDVSRGGSYADLGPGSGPTRGRRTDDDFFSRMIHGFGEDNPPRPPANIGTASREEGVESPLLQRSPQKLGRPRPADIEPRVLSRREDAPIASRPLSPAPGAPTSAPAALPPAPTSAAPATAASPPAVDKVLSAPPAAPAPARATVVNTDPLKIPGTRDAAPKPDAPATTVAKSSQAGAPSAPASTAPAPKAAAARPAPKDVPVAPLD